MRRKKNYAAEIESIVPGQFTISGYCRMTQPVQVTCNTCGYTWMPYAGGFLRSHICPECKKRQTRERNAGTNIVLNLPEGYEYVEEYQGANVPIKIKHSCGLTFRMSPSKCHCPRCTNAVTAEEVQKKLPEGWQLIEYKSVVSGATVKHKCGRTRRLNLKGYLYLHHGFKCECETRRFRNKEKKVERERQITTRSDENYTVFLRDKKIYYRCNYCGTEKQGSFPICQCRTNRIYLSRFQKRYREIENEYELLENFHGFNQEHKWKHKLCGVIFTAKPSELFSLCKRGKTKCPSCMGTRGIKKTDEQVQKELNQRYGQGTFLLLNHYKGYQYPIRVRH